MKATQLRGLPSNGLATNLHGRYLVKNVMRSSAPGCSVESHNLLLAEKKGICAPNIKKRCHLVINYAKHAFVPIMTCRKRVFPVIVNQSCSDCGAHPSNENQFTQKRGHLLSSLRNGMLELTGISTSGSRSVRTELIILALPAIIGQAIEPLSQLMETAYIGRMGAVELASAGVSVSIFNIISKLFNIPLLSITTSFVAEDISKHASRGFVSDGVSQGENNVKISERMQLPSVSTALLLASGIGVIEAVALFWGAGLFLNMMGISSASPMHEPAKRFLSLRALGAPAVVVYLAVQGVFRGFKDTSTPVLCLGLGNLSAMLFLPILIYAFHLGITGAAIATVASQYIIAFLLIWFLNKRAALLPPKLDDLQFGGYVKSGGLLLGRTLAVLTTLTLGTSMAARQGPLAMAAHQICIQVWLAVSLLTDALAMSGQALIASSFSKGDYKRVREITYSVLKTGLLTGVLLAIILGVWFGSLAGLFTKDVEVLGIVRSGVLFVSACQPINALAFVFDGLHYGISDFSYAACSMMLVGAISSAFLLYAPSSFGLPGVWSGLALFMGLRMVSGLLRLGSKGGPWWFLHDLQKIEVTG